MKKPLFAIVLLCLFSSLVFGYSDPQKELEEAFNRFIVAFNNLDWDAFRSLLADDVTVFNPDIPEAPSVRRLDGRQQVEKGFREVFEATRKQASGPPYLHIVPRDIRYQMMGDVGLVTFEFDRDGNSMGRRTFVFRREGRAWKIIHIHASNASRRD